MKLVLIGGGQIPEWNFDTKDDNQTLYETEKIDKKIVELSDKKTPKVLFIGTAKKDNLIYYRAIEKIYTNLGCTVSLLDTMSENISEESLIYQVLNTDIIYIGGGNTRFMLNRWEEIGLKDILKLAIEKNIVVAGFSAGAYSMCKYSYDLIEGMNILNIILAVHYDEKSDNKKQMFLDNIKDKNILGISLDNRTALVVNGNDYEIIKDIEESKAHKIEFVEGTFEIKEINKL